MAYKYDVFLSYNRKRLHGEWVNEIFYPLFEAYLEEALDKDVKIFRDTESIHGGDAWEQRIKDAVIHSKIMVSIFSTAYFRSEWCKKEFAIMDYRQRQCGYLTTEKPDGLIIPFKIFDGESFSAYVKSIQAFDCNKYNLDATAFKQAPLYIDFQNELKNWVEDAARAYNNVPDWNDDWKHPDWVTRSWEDLDKLKGSSSKKPPTL